MCVCVRALNHFKFPTLNRNNVIFLDEPSNDLDVETLRALVRASVSSPKPHPQTNQPDASKPHACERQIKTRRRRPSGTSPAAPSSSPTTAGSSTASPRTRWRSRRPRGAAAGPAACGFSRATSRSTWPTAGRSGGRRSDGDVLDRVHEIKPTKVYLAPWMCAALLVALCFLFFFCLRSSPRVSCV